MRRSLSHYWRIHLAVLFGAAVATAVLTGALLVGDSVRGSLRDLTLDRLGTIDHALVSKRYFREELAPALSQIRDFEKSCETAAPALIISGNIVHSKTQTRASRVNIIGVDRRFTDFYPPPEGISQSLVALLKKLPENTFHSIVINQALQNQLNAEIGDQIVLSFQKPSDIARGSVLGSKDTEDVIERARLVLTGVIRDRGLGRFSLRPNQNLPLNAFVSLPVLQRVLEKRQAVNAILVSQKAGVKTQKAALALRASLKSVLTTADLGLLFSDKTNVFAMASKESILSPHIVDLTKNVAQNLHLPVLSVFTYLANTMEIRGRHLPYSTVSALQTDVGPPFQTLQLTNGRNAPALQENEILLNTWAAEDLGAKINDTIAMSYFTVGAQDELITEQKNFKVRGIVVMTGLASDRNLTPDFPGMAEASNMSDWDPPFPIDLSSVRPQDEDYWDAYRGTPKAFVSTAAGEKLWSSRFGNVTSIRLGAAPAMNIASTRALFERMFLDNMEPEKFDFVFQPVKKQGLAASKGATDFSGLFVGFSLFLIISGALLVGLLFRLGVEQRGHEIGMLLAVGFSARKVRARFLKEGGAIAVAGALLGLGGAVCYAWLMMSGLRTWWLTAVGSPFLFLHVNPLSLAAGYVFSLLIIFVSIWLSFHKLCKIPPPALLAGVVTSMKTAHAGPKTKMIAYASLTLAVLLTTSTFFMDASASAGLFFGVGALLLISALVFFLIWLRTHHKSILQNTRTVRTLKMAIKNSPRNPGRSMLSAALVACACFVIVAVGANQRDFGEEVLRKDSGAGGFSLVAQTDIPLHHDLSSDNGRFDLGFSETDSDAIGQTQIIPFRFLPGEDASCLNLYEVHKPRILGVTQIQIARGGFTFTKVMKFETGDESNPWRALEGELEPGVIPAFGDANSVQWILHSGLGKDIPMTNEFGEKIKLRFVGLIAKSIFQSEVLISEDNFLKHFPGRNGYAYFLIETDRDKIRQSVRILERTLKDYGFDAVTTAEKLANFQAIENTYLSTFQTLGGLGLLLGTLGLGIILIRNVIERRGELAIMRAFGFRRATLAGLVLAENGFLLVLGIFMGAVSALIAVAPHVLSASEQIPWQSLFFTLILVFLVGMIASAVAVLIALRVPLLPALKTE
ncbi:MAG: FtsX-like permease family protein [bacterium]